jgi:hypothetical protein
MQKISAYETGRARLDLTESRTLDAFLRRELASLSDDTIMNREIRKIAERAQ